MRVLSLNLWFSEYLRKERTKIFVNYIMPASLIAASGLYFVKESSKNTKLKTIVPKSLLKLRTLAYTIPISLEAIHLKTSS